MENQKPENLPTIDTGKVSIDEMFSKILKAKIADGAMERAISKKVDIFISECANEAFRSHGEIGTAFKATLTKSIMPSLDKLEDLPTYHHFVMQSLKMAVNRFKDEKLQDILNQEMAIIFEEMPEEITLTWLLDKIKESIRYNESEFAGGELALFIEQRSSFINIYIGKDGDMESVDCEYQIGIFDNSIFRISIDGKDSDNALTIGKLYNFEKQLFNAYVLKSKFVFDKGLVEGGYDQSIKANYGC